MASTKAAIPANKRDFKKLLLNRWVNCWMKRVIW